MDNTTQPTSSSESMKLKTEKLATESSAARTTNVMPMKSSSFIDGTAIPRKYSREGENISPSLTWSDVPGESKELVLICEDPDVPSDEAYVHWIVYGISPQISSLAEGVKPITGAKKGINSDGTLDYTGPMPPEAHGQHNYYFQLFAVNSELRVKEEPSRNDLLQAMAGRVIASWKLVGTYER